MTDDPYLDSFQKLLDATCSPSIVRAIETGGPHDPLWRALDDSGFVDALVPEDFGGAGLKLDDVFPWFVACGSSAMPVPLGFTMYARAALRTAGCDVPGGPITLATGIRDARGGLRCEHVPWGLVSAWALVQNTGDLWLLPTAMAKRERVGTTNGLAANLHWPEDIGIRCPSIQGDLRSVGASVVSAHIAGAMVALLDRSIRYANERQQFGKPIGRFQAIQQQLSAMAEQVFAAHMAAELGCRADLGLNGFTPRPRDAAIAKARCSDAVVRVATTAHAVHGAIGITQDCDVQLLTRRLHEWRIAFGGEMYWHTWLGRDLLAQHTTVAQFVQRSMTAAPSDEVHS